MFQLFNRDYELELLLFSMDRLCFFFIMIVIIYCLGWVCDHSNDVPTFMFSTLLSPPPQLVGVLGKTADRILRISTNLSSELSNGIIICMSVQVLWPLDIP